MIISTNRVGGQKRAAAHECGHGQTGLPCPLPMAAWQGGCRQSQLTEDDEGKVLVVILLSLGIGSMYQFIFLTNVRIISIIA